jgi:FtsP/CotA-like multicopper oxidase with cupredoxin domain
MRGALWPFALACAVLGCSRRPPELREFDGAYPITRAASGRVQTVTLTAAPARVPLFDGRPVDVWSYNGTVPGPILHVRLGDTLRATLENRLPQPTTIHWHGVRLPNAMDGVPGVTQPAVAPGESFTYEFTPRDAGTFWFHPHLSASEQVERGLYGILIVDDPDPPPWHQDLVWVLDDFLIDEHGAIFGEFNTRHDLMHDGRWGNNIVVNGQTRLTLSVKVGERIRLRLVNVANGRIFVPDFGPLAPQAIAVDGMYATHPFAPTGFEMAPGNRLDLDITVPDSLRGRTVEVIDRFLPTRPNHLADIVVADATSPTSTGAFPSPAHAGMPSWNDRAALPVCAEFALDARVGGRFGIEWMLNGQAFDHAAHAHPMHPAATLPLGKVCKLRFVNQSYRLHPMHLHGHFFKLLSRGGVRVNEPHWRDTVLLHAKETVEVALVPLEKGSWMLHCHILEHAESGMMTLVDVR